MSIDTNSIFIPPPGAVQFQPNYKVHGEPVVIWLDGTKSVFRCSMCHGPVGYVIRETLPKEWDDGRAYENPAICLSSLCAAGGRIIE